MTRAFRLTPTLLALVAVAANSSRVSAQMSDAHFIITPEYALAVTPGYRIADNAQAISWSPDSKRVLAISYSPMIITTEKLKNHSVSPETDLFVNRYNTDSHISTVIFKRHFDMSPMIDGTPQWLGKSNIAIQTVVWFESKESLGTDGKAVKSTMPRETLLWIDSYRGTVKTIDVEQGDQVVASPISTMAILIHRTFGPDGGTTVSTIDGEGNVVHANKLPMGAQTAQADWLEDGKSVGLTLYPSPVAAQPGAPAAPTANIPKYAIYSTATGGLQPAEKAKAVPARPLASTPSSGLFLKTTTQHVSDAGIDNIIHPLWLSSNLATEKKQTLVTPDSDMAHLSPTGSGIAFRSGGNAFAADVIRIPADQFKADRAAAQRSILLSNGKQVALEAIMWSADHDDKLPGSTNINDELMPYLKNSQLFDGLNWTYPGGPISGIESPAETILGTIDGADGQAVMYADGHVKWRNR